MRLPETRYTRNGEAAIAYQVLGQGSIDLVLLPGFVSNLEIQWEDSGFGQLARRLAAFARLIIVDRRGTGLSDRHIPADADPLDLAVQDLRAVVEAAGCGRIALFGAFDCASIACRFATLFPTRVRALVLYAPAAPQNVATLSQIIERGWGRGDTAQLFAPEQASDPRFRTWWARFERLSASPSEAVVLTRHIHVMKSKPKASELMSSVLFLHRSSDALVPIAQTRAMAEATPDARFVELPDGDPLIWSGDVDALADALEEFLTSAAPAPNSTRVLATLLVARIVNPERLVARLGENRWQDRLERFAAIAGDAIARQAGQQTASEPTKFRSRFDNTAAAIRAALALREAAQSLDLPLAAGLHVGEVDRDRVLSTGLAFFVAEEIARQAQSGEVLASRVIAELTTGLGLRFAAREQLTVEGVTGPVHIVSIAAEQHLEPVRKPDHEPNLA
ncbi:MAG: alpha/beta fold hydrolase, partial [Burkholderiales bacterium]